VSVGAQVTVILIKCDLVV